MVSSFDVDAPRQAHGPTAVLSLNENVIRAAVHQAVTHLSEARSNVRSESEITPPYSQSKDAPMPEKERPLSSEFLKLSKRLKSFDASRVHQNAVDVSESSSFQSITRHRYARGPESMSLDLNNYTDLSKEPVMFDEESSSVNHQTTTATLRQSSDLTSRLPNITFAQSGNHPEFADARPDVDAQFSGNVQTLMRLVNDLPEGVTKQTGAAIIRLTMEAMGISMEEVLTEAQAAQSEMLDAVRANIKKIEEFKSVIRKLETDIKFFQGKANDLSEIIDLFILSNASSSRSSNSDY
ncbi:MAG: hypothetical protein VKK59_01585 [Vampirovibrionales bacterium]|nr:hypothetical protein [Vampirovibrionales bacterium]